MTRDRNAIQTMSCFSAKNENDGQGKRYQAEVGEKTGC
jgi:hypothetical protein